MYTREDLVADVITEANNIRQHATPEEVNNLSFDDLNPYHIRKCIYGQMTGYCYSERAAELIEKCTPRYFEHGIIPIFSGIKINMARVVENINGVKVDNFVAERTTSSFCHFSAIEAYILLDNAQNENLISLIKGNTQTAEL